MAEKKKSFLGVREGDVVREGLGAHKEWLVADG